MGMAFLLEPWWPLGDKRWGYFALACLVFVLLTYFLPDELKWVTRIQNSSAWKLLRFRMAVFMSARGADERRKADGTLGWEAGGLDDPSLDDRYEDQFRKEIGLPPRVRDDD